MEKAIQVAAVVRLKSGGPRMTVERLSQSIPTEPGEVPYSLARCVWANDDGHTDGELFNILTLAVEA